MNISLTGSVRRGVKLDRTVLKAGENAVLTMRAGDSASPASSASQVAQTNQSSPFKSPSSRVRACPHRAGHARPYFAGAAGLLRNAGL